MNYCLRCGREGHTSSSCKRRLSITGVCMLHGQTFFICMDGVRVVHLTTRELAGRA